MEMELEKGAEAELAKHTSWVPETPIKPIPPRTEPICTDMQEHQQDPGECSGSEEFPPGFEPMASADEVSSHVSAGRAAADALIKDFEALLSGGDSILWPGAAVPATPAATKGPFLSLLALADAAGTGRSQDLVGTSNGSFTCFSDSLAEGHWRPSQPANLGRSDGGSEFPQFSWISANHSAQNPYGFPDLPEHAYDVNFPSRTQAEVSDGAPPHFAPITPDKALGAQSRTASETPDFGEKDRTGQQFFRDSDAARRLILEGNKYVEDLLKASAEDPSAIVSASAKEDNRIEKVDDQDTSMSRTPQQKPRRKRHRPKVVSEGKPRRTPKPRTPKNAATEGETRVKRKYVRRKGVEKLKSPTVPTEVTEDSGRQNGDEPLKKSCKRALNFATEHQMSERIADQAASVAESMAHDVHTRTEQPNEDDQLPQGAELKVGDAPGRIDQTPREDLPMQESEGTSNTRPAQTCFQQEKLDAHTPGTSVQGNTCSAPDNLDMQTLTSQNKTSVSEGEQTAELKRCYDPSKQPWSRYTNMFGVQFNSLQAYESLYWLHFPNIHKKKRTEKGQVPASGASSSTNGKTVRLGTGSSLDSERTDLFSSKVGHGASSHEFLQFSQIERSTKKRSRGLTRVRDTASLSKLKENCRMPMYPSQQSAPHDNSQNTRVSMQALLMEMDANLSRKKRTKRIPLVNSADQRALALQLNGNVLMHQNYDRALTHVPGHQPELFWNHMFPVYATAENLENLDFYTQEQNAIIPYGIGHHEHQKMLVLYRRDGTIVPFEGPFDPTKRRRPRPKVDLDDETTRVWKLLLEDINSEGVDGTDEEKARWWKEERRVFKGRTDSFIARMHLVQGDRRFSPWKGSVVDSVVGVFLTQNVSDHLSSSAFMSLAARFPNRSRQNQCFEEGTSSVINEAEACTLDLEYTSKWIDKMSSPIVCDRNSMTVNETETDEIEVVNSEESFISTRGRMRSPDESKCNHSNSNSSRSFLEIQSHSLVNKSSRDIADSIFTDADPRAEIDVISSQESAALSQNSIDVLKAGIDERKGSSSDNSEIDDLTNRFESSKLSSADGPSSFMQLLHMADSKVPHEGYTLEGERQDIDASIATNSRVLEDECSKESGEEGKSSDSYKFDSGSSMSNGIKVINQATTGDEMTAAENEIPRRSIEYNQTWNDSTIREDDRVEEHTCLPKLSCQNQQNRCSMNHSEGSNQESAEKCLSEQIYPVAKESNELNIRASKAKTSAAGKEKKAEFDWDSLRKQAESHGSKRTRSQNTMDSVDWEAVRSADVNEIAQTIKDRGMNNVLAGRIQDFLDRIVREHGSIDLEWLRDVPPDKAKEYLLSFRGLGLKSVECVRLLTLHHLAFPVDTNVGRIAVRLGWVPLQPLPESLQLHLLELYPVLESIQKYLWPRLCKLDQRTLYELHYQMITFGKVFCTKSKPNCNACPMRGECRHFASAFASARLALPGPEQKSIVSTSETVIPSQTNSEPLQLPSPLAADKSEQQQLAKHGASNCQPIVEEPASPEPECTQIVENDRDEPAMEDFNEIPTIRLNIEEFTQNLQNYMQQNMELQEGDMSKALVALTPEAASIPAPKLKNVSRLRTEHLVYEIPDGHPLLHGLDKLEPDDPSKYLLAIWTPGETANSIEPPEQKCSSQELGTLCDNQTCFSCDCIREANSQTVRGTILIPCRTAMRGSFPLNGTYFQVNEVFADHESSLCPIDVPRDWLWKLHRRTVYFGTSIPAIFKGLSTEGIQHCFWRGYVCVRGFDRQSRAPRPLIARLHFPASKLPKTRGKTDEARN